MAFYYMRHFFSATIAHFDGVSIEYFVQLFIFGKCRSTNFRDIFATFVVTFLLNVGLNQIICCFRFLFVLLLSVLTVLLTLCSYLSFVLKPDLIRLSSYTLFVELKISSLINSVWQLSNYLWWMV